MCQIPSLLTVVDTVDRDDGAGGGVCAIVDSKFSTVQIDTDPNTELVAFDMLLPDTRLRYIVVYRKPEYTAAARLYMESLLVCLCQLCSVDYTVYRVSKKLQICFC